MERRTFLAATAASFLLPPSRSLAGDPFTLGVASGDPSTDGFVLWTRLALDPLSGDGRGGMPSRSLDVDWQISTDERFSKVVRSGTATASPGAAHSVHVEAKGLEPGREYFYRFRSEGRLSRTGRTRTTPVGAQPLTFAVAACAHYEHGYYTAYRRLAEQEPDLVVHLGDYMYEYGPSGYTALAGKVRTHTPGKCATLADYRLRHAQYKSDRDLQKAHAVAPWLVAFDDHELENNWAGPVSSTGAPGFARRRAAAFRAYYENMPLRRASLQGAVLRVNRRVSWGTLARFHLLDTRQFRDDQACMDGVRASCDERLSARRTLLGDDQRRWLSEGLRSSTTRWNLLGQQIMMAQRDYKVGPGREVNLDSWDGYAPRADQAARLAPGDLQPRRPDRRRPHAPRRRAQARLRRPLLARGRPRAGRLVHRQRRRRLPRQGLDRRGTGGEPAHLLHRPAPRLPGRQAHLHRAVRRLPHSRLHLPQGRPREDHQDRHHPRRRLGRIDTLVAFPPL
ncbi:hypothetical protein GCM10020219_069810 [Nonomuraea dietziae]